MLTYIVGQPVSGIPIFIHYVEIDYKKPNGIEFWVFYYFFYHIVKFPYNYKNGKLKTTIHYKYYRLFKYLR